MKKKRLGTSPTKREFAHMLLSLDLFADIYETGAEQAKELIEIIRDIYREEYGEDLDRRTAMNLINTVNERGAGRKPAADRETIRRMKAEGMPVKEIAQICGVSERTVYRIN